MKLRTGAYKEDEDDFDGPDRTPGMRAVGDEEKDEDIEGGEEDASPYREGRNEQGETYCGTK